MSDDVPPLESHLGYRLRGVSNAVSQGFARKVEALGVTVAEWVLLRVLFDVEALSPTEIAERMGMTKGAISKLAERTIAKGLVERQDHPTDRRAQTLALSAAGIDIVPRIGAIANENDGTFFGVLDAAERATLSRLLARLAERHGLSLPPVD